MMLKNLLVKVSKTNVVKSLALRQCLKLISGVIFQFSWRYCCCCFFDLEFNKEKTKLLK